MLNVPAQHAEVEGEAGKVRQRKSFLLTAMKTIGEKILSASLVIEQRK